jgi:hypothetical protein
VGVDVEITPFQERPNLHVSIYDAQGREVASVGAMQIQAKQIGFTLHLRHAEISGTYTAAARLVYPDPDLDLGVVDEAETTFEIP